MLLCRHEDKVAALVWLIREVVKEGEPTIVFSSTRHHVEFLHTLLQAAGISTACVYGAMDQVPYTFQSLRPSYIIDLWEPGLPFLSVASKAICCLICIYLSILRRSSCRHTGPAPLTHHLQSVSKGILSQ